MHLVNDSQNIAFKHIRHAYVIIHADNELYKSPWIQSNGMHHVPQILTHTYIFTFQCHYFHHHFLTTLQVHACKLISMYFISNCLLHSQTRKPHKTHGYIDQYI